MSRNSLSLCWQMIHFYFTLVSFIDSNYHNIFQILFQERKIWSNLLVFLMKSMNWIWFWFSELLCNRATFKMKSFLINSKATMICIYLIAVFTRFPGDIENEFLWTMYSSNSTYVAYFGIKAFTLLCIHWKNSFWIWLICFL